jgi:hypothetical protein
MEPSQVQEKVQHQTLLEFVRQRVLGLACGHAECNDAAWPGDGRNSSQCLKGRLDTTVVEFSRYVAQITRGRSSSSASRTRQPVGSLGTWMASPYTRMKGLAALLQAYVKDATSTAE